MPLHFFFQSANQANVQTVRHTVLVSSHNITNSPDILTGIVRACPLEFARATNGYIYMANGLQSVVKWDGIALELVTVGVIAPTTAITLSVTGSGEISGNYRAYVRFVDEDGNFSNLSPVSNTVTATGNSTVVFDNVAAPTESKVVRRQILRNTAGQFLSFYIDIDTTDLSATSFSSTKTDDDLKAQSAVSLFSENFRVSIADRYGIPPDDKPIIAFYQKRLWLYGEGIYHEGNVQVTFGSTTVTGIGTEFTSEMVGRFLYVVGADRSYEIESVSEANQTLTIASAYANETDLFAAYKIRPAAARRHLLLYSEAGLFDSWPEDQGLDVASSDDVDDEGTGLVSTHSFLYILQRRHIYRLSFLDDPIDDGGIFLSARRGCVNNRSWVTVDGFLYCLDDRGIYRFDGSDTTEDLSPLIQDLFYFNREEGDLRINWDGGKWFHASHDRNDATIRWFVAFSGEYLPRHAICFNYGTPQWWIEEYPFAVGDSTLFKQINSLPIVAGKYRKVYAMQIGSLDVVNPQEGTTRGLVASATRRSISAAAGTQFPTAGVVGAPLAIVDGRGKGQWRLITAVSSETLTVNDPWTVQPDDTSTFQVGGMPWKWRSGWNDWPVYEWSQPRRISVGFQPSGTPNEMDLRVYTEYSETPTKWGLDWPRIPSEATGIETANDDPDAEIDLQQSKGFSYLTLDSFDMYDEFREGLISVELRGFSAGSPVVVYQVGIQGAVER